MRQLLVLHGLSMAGQSMLRRMGKLRDALEAAGFELIAPTAAYRMRPEDVSDFATWAAPMYEKAGQDVWQWFKDGVLFDAGENFEWFRSETGADGRKIYHALERGLDVVADAIRGRDPVGVLGFSQGSAMATIVAALSRAGDERFRSLRFGVFMSGFAPRFDAPLRIEYPIPGPFPGMFVVGAEDPVFSGGRDVMAKHAAAFASEEQEILVVPDLGHDLPQDDDPIAQIVDFVKRA